MSHGTTEPALNPSPSEARCTAALRRLPAALRGAVLADPEDCPLNEDFLLGHEDVAAAVRDPDVPMGQSRRQSWEALPGMRVVPFVADAVSEWAACLLPDSSVCCRARAFASDCWGTEVRTWPEHPWVVAIGADLLRIAVQIRAAPPAYAPLRRLRALLVRWLRPVGAPSRHGRFPQLAFLWHLLGLGLFLGECATAAEDRAAVPRTAARRLVAFTPPQRAALTGAGSEPAAAALAPWWVGQVRVLAGVDRARAGVYMMCAGPVAYIGMSANIHAAAGAGQLGFPDRRAAEHVRDVLQPARRSSMHKLRAFRASGPGDITFISLATGTPREMGCLERRLIKQLAPRGNATFATRHGWRRTETDAPPDRPGAARSRPPPRLRAGTSPARSAVQAAQNYLPRDLDRLFAAEARRATSASANTLREAHFDVAYWAHRAVTLQGACGPVDITVPTARAVFIAQVCTRSAAPSWEALWRTGGRRAFYEVGSAVRQLKRPGRRLLASQRWRRCSQRFGELPWAFKPLALPRGLPQAAVRQVLRQIAAHLARGCPWRALWVRTVLRPVQEAQTTYARRCFGMAAAARTCHMAELDAASPDVVRRALAGADMLRSKRYWKLPVVEDATERWRRASATVSEWLAVHSPCMPTAWRRQPLLLEPLRRAGRLTAPILMCPVPAPTAAYAAYVQELRPARHGEVLVIEDKDVAAAWRCGLLEYRLRTRHYLEADGVWRRSPLTPLQAGRYLEKLFRGLAARGLTPRCSAEQWARGVPSLYSTVKAKCWEDGRHSCERHAHCCVRRICSWARLPARALLRRVGKAWRLLVLWLGHGGGTPSLLTAARDLRARAALLEPGPDPSRCTRCGAHKTASAAVVMDASAMYEQAPPDEVLVAATTLAEVFRRRGFRGVLVEQTRQLRGRPWRPTGAYLAGWQFVSFVDMIATLQAFLAVRVATFGDTVYEQTRGLPIGGQLSDLSAALLLSLQEATWRQLHPLRVRAGFGALVDSRSCDKAIAQARYVDDMLCLSRSVCPDCLAALIVAQHPGIPFAMEASSAQGALPWLDLVVHSRRHPPHICMQLAEREWVANGAPHPRRFRVQPFLGRRHADFAGLRSHIRSSLTRWAQVGLTDFELAKAFAYHVLLFLRADYPPRLVVDAWVRHSEGYDRRRVVLAVLDRLQLPDDSV